MINYQEIKGGIPHFLSEKDMNAKQTKNVQCIVPADAQH
jgi:hypothetical protein